MTVWGWIGMYQQRFTKGWRPRFWLEGRIDPVERGSRIRYAGARMSTVEVMGTRHEQWMLRRCSGGAGGVGGSDWTLILSARLPTQIRVTLDVLLRLLSTCGQLSVHSMLFKGLK